MQYIVKHLPQSVWQLVALNRQLVAQNGINELSFLICLDKNVYKHHIYLDKYVSLHQAKTNNKCIGT